TPPWHVAMPGASGAVRGPQRIPAPCVVKPIASGSSIDVFICREESQVHDAVTKIMRDYGQALLEKLIVGTELTVGILEEQPLSPIRITTNRDFFDYTAKYTSHHARHDFNLGLSSDIVQ